MEVPHEPLVALEHRFVETTHAGRIDTLLETLNGERDLALVFVRTKHGADKLVKKLEVEGIRAVAMHGTTVAGMLPTCPAVPR